MAIAISKKHIIYNTKTHQKENADTVADDPKLYLSRYINSILKQLVDTTSNFSNKVLGVEPFFLDLVNNKIFRIVISPGLTIIDSTLIEIPTALFLDIDISQFLEYDEVAVICGYSFLSNNNKASFQIVMRNSKTDEVASNSALLFDKGLNILILSRFRIVRDTVTKTVKYINHPYGRFVNTFYSDYLKTISNIAKPITNKIFQLLRTEVDLYRSFKVKDVECNISVPLFLNHKYEDGVILADAINIHYKNKMYRRYPIDSIHNSYFSKTDRSLKFRTEIFDA